MLVAKCFRIQLFNSLDNTFLKMPKLEMVVAMYFIVQPKDGNVLFLALQCLLRPRWMAGLYLAGNSYLKQLRFDGASRFVSVPAALLHTNLKQ